MKDISTDYQAVLKSNEDMEIIIEIINYQFSKYKKDILIDINNHVITVDQICIAQDGICIVA